MNTNNTFDGIKMRLRIHLRRGRREEALKYLFKKPREKKGFLIVSSQKNAGRAAVKCMESVFRQHYDRSLIRHVMIDDASTDGTGGLIEDWLAAHPDHNVEFIRNPERLGGTVNNLTGFRMAAPGQIVIELNGDDWLPDQTTIGFLNKVFDDGKVWMTYNTHRFFVDGEYREFFEQYPIPEQVIKSNGFRDHPWIMGAPHVFRAELFFHVKEESMIDPETGEYWKYADDQALYLPMFEMARSHARHLYRISYIYNFREMTTQRSDYDTQMDCARRIRLLPRYEPLEKLF